MVAAGFSRSRLFWLGVKQCLVWAGVCFLVGALMIVTAGTVATGMTVYTLAWAGMLLSGIGWCLTEAAINPLTEQLYAEDPTHRSNVLHACFRGGIIIGGLAGLFLSAALPWLGERGRSRVTFASEAA